MTKRTDKPRSGAGLSTSVAVRKAMRQQALRVPWRELASAREQMIEWRSFALWVRAVVSAEQALPGWLRESIDQRCPGFLGSQNQQTNDDSIWLDLTDWVDQHCFGAPRGAGWLEALHYYSGRDPRSELTWEHWTHTESEWQARRPDEYPSFELWHRQALGDRGAAGESGISRLPAAAIDFAALVNEYIEWEAFAFWARLIVESVGNVPDYLKAVVSQRCPGFATPTRPRQVSRSKFATEILAGTARMDQGARFFGSEDWMQRGRDPRCRSNPPEGRTDRRLLGRLCLSVGEVTTTALPDLRGMAPRR